MKELKSVRDVVSGVTAASGFVVELLEKEPFVEKEFNEKKVVLRGEVAQKEVNELIPSVLKLFERKPKW